MPGRLPRHVLPGKLHEITFRCHQSRPLLRPSEKVNQIVKGCLAKSQQATDLEIIWVVVMSNHAHLLARPTSPIQLADFLCHFKGNLSKEIGRLHSYPGGIFAGTRTDVAPVTDEPEAQTARLLYLLSQGVKDGLCPTPWSWPGVHCASALRAGKLELEGGIWTDRSAMCDDTRAFERRKTAKTSRGRKKGPRFKPRTAHYREALTVQLSKLPCWESLTDEEYCAAVCQLMQSAVGKHREQVAQLPNDWKRRILSKVPNARPHKTRRGPRVLVHAASKAARVTFRKQLQAWLEQYWRASERLRQGYRDALRNFPPNCFPPPLPATLVADN